MTQLPMFPLGSTVFPQQVVPLHIFEERYRTLLEHVTADDDSPGFGIVLIDRGHEVGGGDVRTSVGTRVKVLQAERFDDGRWGIVVLGVERIDILEWLPDDPYPLAVVTPRSVADDGGSSLDDLESSLQETIDLIVSASGAETPEPYAFDRDPHVRLDQMSAVAPVGDFDRQRILEAATTSEQMARLSSALEDKQMLLRAQLGQRDEFG